MAVAALSHRLMLRTDRGARLDPVDAIGEILADVPVPDRPLTRAERHALHGPPDRG